MKQYSGVNSQRQLKAANLIKQALIEVLQKGKMLDVRLLDAGVTVSEVVISPDLKIATCKVLNFMQDKLSADDLIDAFDKSKHAIRNMVTKKVNLKYSPELRFKYDHSFSQASKINQLLMQNKVESDNDQS